MILFRQKVAIPDFLEVQRKSFRLFLETGIRRELEFITSMDGDPVSDKSNPLQDEYVSGVFLANKFYFKRPVCTPQEAIVQMETYQSTLVVPLYLVSKTSGFSLGKVNYCIKALTEVGFIKCKSFLNHKNKSGYLYLLTAKGVNEKAELTKIFLQKKQLEYERLYNYFHEQ